MPEPLYRSAYVRCYTPPSKKGKRKTSASRPVPSRPRSIFVFDWETTVDEAQRGLFASYRYYRIYWYEDVPSFECVDEALVIGDGLTERQERILRKYAAEHQPDVVDRGDAVFGPLRVITREELAREIIKACWMGDAICCGFNLPFDLFRTCVDLDTRERLQALAEREARGEEVSRKGSSKTERAFSVVLASYIGEKTGEVLECQFSPRLKIEIRDSKRAQVQFKKPLRKSPFRHSDGLFLDCKQLAFAQTGAGYSLAGACEAYEIGGWQELENAKRRAAHGRITPEYIDYNRSDVAFTAALAEKLLVEHYRHPIDHVRRHPCNMQSPASYGKAYYDAMNIRVPTGISDDVQGYAMAGFFGGRSEARIRQTVTPGVHTDYDSMYQTVNALLGTWRFVTASSIKVEERDPKDAQRWLDQLTREDLFDQQTWPEMCELWLVEPNGCVFPYRTKYERGSDALSIGSNHDHSSEPRWCACPDVVFAALHSTGPKPRVIRALRLKPGPRQRGLRPTKLYGQIPVDPRDRDFFKTVVECRYPLKRAGRTSDKRTATGLKFLGNSTAYGMNAEVNPTRVSSGKKPEPIEMYGEQGKFTGHAPKRDEPGVRFCAPIATLITAAARLMLGLLELEIRERGGWWAFMDTDSAFICATKRGGLVPCESGEHRMPDGRSAIKALSWAQVREIVAKFERLNPYDREIMPGSILKSWYAMNLKMTTKRMSQ